MDFQIADDQFINQNKQAIVLPVPIQIASLALNESQIRIASLIKLVKSIVSFNDILDHIFYKLREAVGNDKCEIKLKRRLQYQISHSSNIIFNIFLIIQYSQMSEQPLQTAQQSKKEEKANNRWTNISSDEDQSESEKSQKQQKTIVKPKQEEVVPVQAKTTKEEVSKKEPHIVPFDARKKFRGEFANIKTIKGGFKAQKVQQKKFRLDTVKNPFQVDDQSSDEEKEQKVQKENLQQKQQEKISVEQPQQAQQKGKKTKKSKKQQEKEELQALLKELNVKAGIKGEEGEKKKKKKKAKKEKVEGQEQLKQQAKVQEAKVEASNVQQQAVNREAIEEVMRKKAEAAKNATKKAVKPSVASNARKAIQQREAKNKQKKVFVDL